MIRAKTLQDLFKRFRRPGDLVFSTIFVLFSLFLTFKLPSETTWSTTDKLFAQPAFWPYAAVITMLVFSILHLISGLVSEALPGRWQEVGFWARSLEFAGWFLGYVLLVPVLGYLLATIVIAVALCLRLGYRSRKMMVAAIGFAIVVVIIFKTFLHVKVPGGALYEYLPTAIRSFMLTYF